MPYLELKRKSLLQQAQNAAETLEREYRELEGFIGGHSYGNYMQHLQTSDVDPTAGGCVPTNDVLCLPLIGFLFHLLASSSSSGSCLSLHIEIWIYPMCFSQMVASVCHQLLDARTNVATSMYQPSLPMP